MSRLILDLSRTLSRAVHPIPTGIDRVEMAYAEGLLARAGDRLEFAAMHPLGRCGTLPKAAACRFLALTAARWRGGGDAAAVAGAARALRNAVLLWGDLPTGSRLRRRRRDAAYLLVSHHHLDRPGVIETALRRRNAAFICQVQDLIPMEFQEYARATGPAQHQRRIECVAALADGVMVTSQAVQRSLQPWLDRAGRSPPVLVAPLGADVFRPRDAPAPRDVPLDAPYFLFLGTIEPRKNHLLALHVWRRLAEELGPEAPRLVVAGRRGWENEQVIDLLERCAPLKGLVFERGDLSDGETLALMQGARALLLPSFAEGYGLPVAEALSLQVPVICSDLPSLREIGHDVPDYIDPLDGMALLRAVKDFAAPDSPRRAAQLRRMQGWRAPSWEQHIDAALAFTERVLDRAGGN